MNISEELESLSARISALESERDQLHELINEMMDVNNNNAGAIELWEVIRVLTKWVNGDD